MNREQTLAELEKMIREAPVQEAIAFIETLVEKQPELRAPLMAALQEHRKV